MSEEDEIIAGYIYSVGTEGSERYEFADLGIPTNLKGVRGDISMSMKSIEGSTQSQEELGISNRASFAAIGKQFIEPPYSPTMLANFLEEDVTHYRAVKAKVSDIVGKPYRVKSFRRIVRDDQDPQKLNLDPEDYILASEYRQQVRAIEDFIEHCNPEIGFIGTLTCAAMDYQAIGWGALEVVRSMDKKLYHLVHVPASRIRVLKGRKGFVELTEEGNAYRYYQNFGEKVGKRRKSPLTGKKEFRPFDASQDSFDDGDIVWNLMDKTTGDPLKGSMAANFDKVANEILFIRNVHPNTVYYGYSDIIAALGSLISNLHIRNYVNQFFEHNAVPRYAVVVTGGVLSDEIKKGLIDYFTTEVKGQAHKTLVLCLPSSPTKEIKIEFKQLDTAHKEADFLETERRNQSNIQVAHGTPPAILGVAEHSELGSGKGLSQAELYKDRIVAPAQYFWQEKLYELTSKGLGITDAYITFSPFDVRDRYMQSQVLTNLLDRGIYNINDALEELDKPPVPGGDVNFVKGDKFIKIEDLATLNSTVPSENTNEEPQPGTENNSQEGDNELPPTE